ncbi:MAG: hypothetical protein RR015_04775, partial [Bacteroidales bacterium]
MKRVILFYAILLICIMSVYSQSTGAYYNYETECLGIEHDGSQTLRVWANGRNRSDALEQG